MGDRPDSRHDTDTDSDTDSDDARWIDLAELAALRGIDRDSATTLVRRHGWRRQRDNQGRIIALVPLAWIEPDSRADSRRDTDTDKPDSRADSWTDTGEIVGVVRALETAVTVLREQLASAEARADRAQQAAAASDAAFRDEHDRLVVVEAKLTAAAARADQAEALADHAEQALTGERTRADALRDRLDTAELARRQAEETAGELRRAEIAWQARGLLARLRDAWRGR
jgi:hypothetical protein